MPVRFYFVSKRPENVVRIAKFPYAAFGPLFAFHCPLFVTKNNNLGWNRHASPHTGTTLVRPLLEYSSSVWDPHTKTLVNKIEMVQRRAARFCHNDYKTIEKGCVSEMIRKLNLEPLNIRRTNKRLTIFHKASNGHLALPIGHLQPVLRRTRHLNSKAYNTIHTSKDCYKYSFFPRTIKDWNSLPDKIATIKEPHKFKFALAHFD